MCNASKAGRVRLVPRVLRSFAAICLAACVAVPASASDTDENGLTPSMWFKFDGDATNYGSNGATITPVGTYETVSGTDQALVVSGSAASGSGAPTAMPYTLHLRAKLVTETNKSVCGFGGGQVGGFNFVIANENQVGIREHGYSSWKSYLLPATTVAGANDDYHYFTYVAESGSSKLYYDGKLIASSTASRTAGNGLWSIGKMGGNAADAVPVGVKIADLRTYNVALTEDQISRMATPALIWGTAGRLGDGVATKSDGKFGLDSWTFNLAVDDNTVHDTIDLTKKVVFRKIRLMQRAGKENQPTAATLTQGALIEEATSVTSHDDDATGMTLYDSTGVASVTRGYHEFVFAGTTEFDPTANIQLAFDNAKTGCSVMQPPNSVMGTGTWSPVIEISAAYPSDDADYVATVNADTTFSGITTWTPSRPAAGFAASDILEIDAEASATLTFDEALTVRRLKVVSNDDVPFCLVVSTMPTIDVYDFARAAGGVRIDATALDGTELAKKTVAGAPYSHWLLKGSVRGAANLAVDLPDMPSGYDAEAVADGYGVRIVVTAPKAALFGSVDINFMGNKSKGTLDANSKVGGLTTDVGAHPVIGTSWTDLESKNHSTNVTKYVNSDGSLVTGVTMPVTISQCANSYGSGAANNTIFHGYIDDSQSPIVQIGSIPFAKYRVIVYSATDSDNLGFASPQIGATSSSAPYYYGPNYRGDAGATLSGSAAKNWGNGSSRTTCSEGLNYVVSDVLEGGSAYVKMTRNGDGRGTIAAIQIVEVDKIIEGYKEYKATISSAGTHSLSGLSWSPSPFNPNQYDNVKVTIDPDVVGNVTITLDKGGMEVDQFLLVSKGEATVTLAGSNPTLISAWDFSSAKGRVAFGFEADYTKVTLGTYPLIGLAYPYTGTITNGFEYMGTGNALTLTTIRNGTIIIGGSGTLHGTLDVITDVDGGTAVTIGGTYTSPNDDVELSCSRGQLTIAEGADISVTHLRGNKSGTYGGGAGNTTVNGRLTVAKDVTVQYGYCSPRGIHLTVGKTGSLIAEGSQMLMANPGYNYCSLTIDGGLVKVRGINVGNSSAHGAACNPAVTVKNGGTLQLAGDVINQNNGKFLVNDGTLSAYSYNSSTGYTWSPTNTAVTGTLTIDPNGLAIASTGDINGDDAQVVVASSTSGGLVTLSGASTYGGGTTVQAGSTVKMANRMAFGTGSVTVADGATLDLNGNREWNALTLSGSGVDGAGALVNGASEEGSCEGAITFAGATTIGGTGTVSLKQGATVTLGGNALALACRVKFGSFTMKGGGTVTVLSGGVFAVNGGTALDSADLAIEKGGSLDLSGGSSVSCRGFSCLGGVTGAQAKLLVKGTFDATTSVTIPKLKLYDNAVLKGVGLVITESLEMEDTLYVEVSELKPSIKIATVPTTGVTLCKYPYVNGRTTYAMVHRGTALNVVEGERVLADVHLDSVLGWTNFEELKVEGYASDFHGSAFGQTNINIVVSSGDGTVTTQSFAYVVGEDGRFRCVLEGVDVGCGYDVSAFLTIEGADVDASSPVVNVVTARPAEGWIDEDADTFSGAAEGTGNWLGTKGVAGAVDGVIAFSNDWEWIVEFQPTNDSQTIRSSLIKDIHYKVSFTCPGLYSYEDAPSVPEEWYAAVTLIADFDDTCHFAIVSNGVWVTLPRVGYPGDEHEYEFVVRVDYRDTNVVYCIVEDNGTMSCLATCPFTLRTSDLSLPIAGSGHLASELDADPYAIKGVCQDINLFEVGGDEFENLDMAREAAGETRDIVPLWKSRFTVSGKSGLFRIFDQYGLLELLWEKWHHFFVTKDGSTDVYDYLSGNNWIEYADVGGVETNEPGLFVVRSAEGLAWIAETATNRWFYGTVALGNDIDLAEMNWTPVSQFSGLFDGAGFVVRGLNNTNVVERLGAAGRYPSGPTNDFGRTAYGLFATATNAAFRNVAFDDVAIDNGASSVAVLLGMHAGGDLSVSNVTVSSGEVFAEDGGAVAGIVGTAENWGDLTVVNNTNAAQYVGSADDSGARTSWTAGIMTVGGTNETVGALVVTGNVNRATIVNVVRNDGNGGNVAQILAGTSFGTRFGEVEVTNNAASGEVAAEILDHDGWRLGPYDEWLTKVFPICNLAPAVTFFTEADGYRRFVEANDPASIPVDPVHRNARMLAGTFQNGVRNFAGEWMDTITAMENGGSLWITGELLTNDTWQTVTVDRSIGFDLRGNTIYTIYDTNTFCVTHDAELSISNGTIIVPEGVAAFGCIGASRVVSNDINVVSVPGDFYDRTVRVDGAFASMGEFLSLMGGLCSGTTVEMEDASGFAVDPASNTLTFNGSRVARFSEFRSLVPTSADSTAYVVELNGNAVPAFDLKVSQAATADGEVTISLSGTRGGLYYAVQHKGSLVQNEWSDASDWQYVAADGDPVSFVVPAEGASGFYRVKVTDVLQASE